MLQIGQVVLFLTASVEDARSRGAGAVSDLREPGVTRVFEVALAPF